MTILMNAGHESFVDEFVESAYSCKQVDEANTSEMLLGIDTSHCFFLKSNTLSIPLTAT